MDSLRILLKNINGSIIKLSKFTKNVLYNLYKYIDFAFKKRKTIKKIYEPIITSKEQDNKLLLQRLKELESKKVLLDKDLASVKTNLNNLERKIEYIEKNMLN